MSSTFVQAQTEGVILYRGLRGWLDEVQKMGELLHVNGAHWDAEMGAVTQMLTEKSNNTAPAILFDEVPGYPKGFRTLYGHFSSIRRVALTLGIRTVVSLIIGKGVRIRPDHMGVNEGWPTAAAAIRNCASEGRVGGNQIRAVDLLEMEIGES